MFLFVIVLSGEVVQKSNEIQMTDDMTHTPAVQQWTPHKRTATSCIY